MKLGFKKVTYGEIMIPPTTPLPESSHLERLSSGGTFECPAERTISSPLGPSNKVVIRK